MQTWNELRCYSSGDVLPLPQDDLGPLQGVPHTRIFEPITRQSRTLRVADNVVRDLDKAVSLAMGEAGSPGPVYLELPTDVLLQQVPMTLVLDEHLNPRAPRRSPPDPDAVHSGCRTDRARRTTPGNHRARSWWIWRSARRLSRCDRRGVSRYAGKPGFGFLGTSGGCRRGAWPGDARGGSGHRYWKEAGLPARLWIAGGLFACHVSPNRRCL